MSSLWEWLAADCTYCAYDLQHMGMERGDPLSTVLMRATQTDADVPRVGDCLSCRVSRLARVEEFESWECLSAEELTLTALGSDDIWEQRLAAWWLGEKRAQMSL